MTPLRPQKITMLIEVLPSPRLDIIREPGHKMPEVGSPIDDGLLFEAVDDAAGHVEMHASSLAFNVSPEDLFLLDSESMESLLSGLQKSVIVVFPNQKRENTTDDDCEAKQKDHAKIRL